MQIQSQTKGGIQIKEIALLKTSCADYRYVVVLFGFPTPYICNEHGVCEVANDERGDDDFNLVMIK
jgi:hypothetical protein